jgi:hypothetical protein
MYEAAVWRASCGVSGSSAPSRALTHAFFGPVGSGFLTCFQPHAVDYRARSALTTPGRIRGRAAHSGVAAGGPPEASATASTRAAR